MECNINTTKVIFTKEETVKLEKKGFKFTQVNNDMFVLKSGCIGIETEEIIPILKQLGIGEVSITYPTYTIIKDNLVTSDKIMLTLKLK